MLIRKTVFILFLYLSPIFFAYAQTDTNLNSSFQLTIENIMRDPKWIGTSPSKIFWSEDSKRIYFMWNPENAESESLYVVSRNGVTPRKVTIEEQKKLPSRWGHYNRNRSKKVYENNGDIFLLDIKSGRVRQITNTLDRESNPQFAYDEKKVTFTRENNLYLWRIDNGENVQLTNFRKGKKVPEKKEPGTEQEKWLQQEELKLIHVLKERKERREREEKGRKALEPKRLKEIYIDDKTVRNVQLSPDEQYITFLLYDRPKNRKRTIIPNYITESGFAEDIPSRTKVGAPEGSYQFGIYDIPNDTVRFVSTKDIPGIYDEPEYLKDYKIEVEDSTKDHGEESSEKKIEKRKPREVRITGPFWSKDGRCAAVDILASDNKDRWIMSLDLATGKLALIDRQHDNAWIGGAAVSRWWGRLNVGWMPDNRRIWFLSEESGFSHLYTMNVETGEKKQLTGGKFEVSSPQISKDEKYWYFSSNKVHPGESHFYRMPLNGGKCVQITKMTGSNRVYLSPDEKMLAILYSYSNRPWELYLMENKSGTEAKQITNSISEEFKSYPWRDPKIITFKARDGVDVYVRLYQPYNTQPKGPAVIFVHGAGYLQNAHKWWSSYFREYMFHNFLIDHGYTVLDIDYRGSAGYGRDWRIAIYRHMGGKDLDDQVDGAKFLVEKYNVDPKRIGIYGGSYGGFITLMAMFTEPDVFTAGAALRPVTDWAHYSGGYTSNILNLPTADSLAYVRSSPIYYAEGLQGALLICHGMIDTNVHFQDAVRLVQRLIELGKENWEVAIYPLEDHSFREPSSWTDEYKRIFKLFEESLVKSE